MQVYNDFDLSKAINVLMNRMPNPYNLITLSLIIILAINIFFGFDINKLLSPLIAVITAVIFDYLITMLKTKKGQIKQTALITGLIVGFVVNYNMPLYAFLSSALAIIIKHIIRHNNSNIFNPAASGMIITFLINRNAELWWVSAPNILILAPMLILGFLVSLRIMRLYASLSYIIGAIIIIIAFRGFENFNIFYVPMFGPFFMITEPKTSPIKAWQQIVFGFAIAIVDAISGYLNLLQSTFLLGLLFGNLMNAFLFRRL
ncbi:MAG: RnfABCDGE type electron transport complex subunit D [Candidatus Anstonellales archaeon]